MFTKYYKLLCFFSLIVISYSCDTESTKLGQVRNKIDPSKEIFYHIFQRSFYDSNEDLHGDFNGVIQKIPYLKELGITSVLMTPFYTSKYYHNYFPDHFETIDEKYGTRDEYLKMVETFHQNDMKFYMDMEIQYVTKNHEWFQSSFENPESGYSDYVIYNGEGNTDPETIIFNLSGLKSYTGDSMDITTVNLNNEFVKEYFSNLFKIWVDPNVDGDFRDGVDGFRIDHMMDDLDLKGKLTNLLSDFWRPLFAQLKSLNPELKIIAEQADWSNFGADYFNKSDVDFMFAFDVRNKIVESNNEELINSIANTMDATPIGKHQLFFLENHDLNRYASNAKNTDHLKLGAALSILNVGVPLIYYGQELGMKGEGGFGKFGNSDANDIPRREAFEWHAELDGEGMALWYKNTGPWWDNSYLVENDGISYEEQVNDRNSLYHTYKTLIEIRKKNQALTKGDYEFISAPEKNAFALLRWEDDSAFIVVFNLSDENINLSLPIEINYGSMTIKEFKFICGNEDDLLNFENSILKVNLPPYGFSLWKMK